MFKKPRVYLDYAAATPLRKEVYVAMLPHLTQNFGNASAIHREGVAARKVVEEAREGVARTLQVRPEFVTFVSGGTEANNLAILGTVEQLHLNGRAYRDMEVITTDIEHPSVLEVMKILRHRGVVVHAVAVDGVGKVNGEALRTIVNSKTVLFSVAYANSEIGTVQNVHAIKKVLAEAEKMHGTKIMVHIDAAQAPLWLLCQLEALGADLLALDVGKCNGPKGVGILVCSRRVSLAPTLYGGGQEHGLRPGTENVAGIVGASVALALAQRDYKDRAERVASVRDAGLAHMLEVIPEAVLNGAVGADRLANNINISIPRLDTEFATIVLDKHGFAVSTKSACAGASGGESTVVKVISGDSVRSRSTLRISLSPETTMRDIQALTMVLKDHCAKMKNFD